MLQVQVSGLESTLGYFGTYQSRIEEKQNRLIQRLAEVGVDAAKMQFNSFAFIDNPKPVNVYARAEENGVSVIAEGEQVAFIEFGTGVFYNGSESYAGVRPPEVAGIGEYGKGKGKQNTWGYYDENGKAVLTHGNPPSNSMWYASEVILKVIADIAKEVLAND